MRLSVSVVASLLAVAAASDRVSAMEAGLQFASINQVGMGTGNTGALNSDAGMVSFARQLISDSLPSGGDTEFATIKTVRASSAIGSMSIDPRNDEPADVLWQGNVFKPYAVHVSTSAVDQTTSGPDLNMMMWTAAGLMLLGLVPGLGLMTGQGRASASPRTAAPIRRIPVDTSAFVRASAPLHDLDDELPSMRDVGASPFWETPADPGSMPILFEHPRSVALEEYRLFRLNSTGLVEQAETGLFGDVDDALRRAAMFGEGAPVEVWRGRQRVTVVSDPRPPKALTDYIFQEPSASRSGTALLRREFTDDAAAMAHAMTLSQGQSVEVRCNDRLVGTLRSGRSA